RKENIHMLEDVGCCLTEVEKPHKRELPSWLYYYKANNPQLAGELTNPACWRPFLFDGDSSL
ncbi:MAG: hypothetical protein M3Z32_13800, partial [Acidobacteriota bacterium]|nr:hypothetical protein [Acidobacteriota bacterium]